MDSPLQSTSRAYEDHCATPDPHAYRRTDPSDTHLICNCGNQTTFIAAANNLTTAAQALAAAASALAAAGDSFRLLGVGHSGLDIFSNRGVEYINPPPQPIPKPKDDSDSWQQPFYVLPSGERPREGLAEREGTADKLLPAYPIKPGKRRAEDSTSVETTEPKKRRKKVKIVEDAVVVGAGDTETGPDAPAESAQLHPGAVAAKDVSAKDPAPKKKKKKAKVDSEAQRLDGARPSDDAITGSSKVTKEKTSKRHTTLPPPKSSEPHASDSDVSEPSASSRVELKVIQLKSGVDGQAAPAGSIGRKTSGKRVTWAHSQLSDTEVNSDAESRRDPDSPREESVPDSEPE